MTYGKRKKSKMSVRLAFAAAALLLLLTCFFGLPAVKESAAAAQPLSDAPVTERIDSSVYVLRDNTGYATADAMPISPSASPIRGGFINLRLASAFGDVGLQKNGFNRFSVQSSGQAAIEFNYIDSSIENINGSVWSLSNDTATAVDGRATGFVGAGALIVEKSYNGMDFSDALKAVDVPNKMAAPDKFNGDEFKQLYNFSYDDLNKGVYVRVMFAYEIVRSFEVQRFTPLLQIPYKETKYEYLNIVECAVVYIANDSGTIGFHNLTNDTESLKDFILDNTVSSVILNGTDKEKTEQQLSFEQKFERGEATRAEKIDYVNSFEDDESDKLTEKSLSDMAQLYRNGETLKNGGMSATGFSLETFNGDISRISCLYNGSERLSVDRNGQIFSRTGKYEFKVTTALHRVHNYTVYVNPKSKEASKADYFDGDFITANSKRLYAPQSYYPVFCENAIKFKIKPVENIVPLSGYIAEIQPKADESGESDVKILRSYISENSKNATADLSVDYGKVEKYNPEKGISGQLDLKAGSYAAVFYSCEDYRGGLTGDYYTFTYLFDVAEKDDVTGPVVNQAYLKSISTIANLTSKYYGVELPCTNGKIVTYAFGTYERAYAFAYEYELSVLVPSNEPQYEQLKAVHERAGKRVVEKYFDASDESTYLTAGAQKSLGDYLSGDGVVESGADVLNMNLARDVVVFSQGERAYLKTALPYINGGSYAFLNEKGEIERGRTEFKFISVAEYDSYTVTLINTETKERYPMEYGVSAEVQLKAAGAPSGKYKVEEKARYGDGSTKNSYYFVQYIANENTAAVEISYLKDGVVHTDTINNSRKEQTFSVNSFVIKSVTDELDNYGIVKITGGGKTDVYSIWEAENLAIEKNGGYVVELVNRLGFSYSFNVTVSKATEAAFISFDSDGGEQAADFVGYVGVRADLPQPKKDKFTFAGWSDADGNVYTTAVTPTKGGSILLRAVWEHEKTEIAVADGDSKRTFTVFPGARFSLPAMHKTGYTLFGLFYESEGGNKVYIHEISSVPNVAEMTLTAVWKREGDAVPPPESDGVQVSLIDGNNVQTVSAQVGQSLPLPELERAGMDFMGWMKVDGLEGVIYSGELSSVPDSKTVVLTAVYKTAAAASPSGGIAGWTSNFFPPLSALLKYCLAALLMLVMMMSGTALMKKKYYSRKGFIPLFAGVKLKAHKLSVKQSAPLIRADKGVKSQSVRQSAVSQVEKPEICSLAGGLRTINALPCGCGAAYENGNQGGNAFNGSIIQGGKSSPVLKHRQSNGGTPKHKRTHSMWFAAVCCLLVALFVFNPTVTRYIVGIQTGAAQAVSRQCQVTPSDIEKLIKDNPPPTWEQTHTAQTDLNPESLAQAEIKGTEIKGTAADLERSLETDAGQAAQPFEMSEEESFLYAVEMLALSSEGYSVFPASIIADGAVVYGLGYTKAEQFYEKPELEKTIYVATGFTAFVHQRQVTSDLTERGLIVHPLEDKDTGEVEVKYLLTFEKTDKDEDGNIFYRHYVKDGKYVRYALYDLAFHIAESSPFDKNRTDYRSSLGRLYSYDDGFVVYDPDFGKADENFTLNAETITENITPQQAEMFFKSFIAQQDSNYLTAQLTTQVYISQSNIDEFLLSQQDELFLGIPAEQKRQLQKETERLFSEGIYYYVYEDADGNIQVGYSVDESMQPKPNAEVIYVGCLLILSGIILCFVCPPAGVGATEAGAALTATAVAGSIILGALQFGIIAAGTNLMIQGFSGADLDSINWASFAIETAVGAVTGAMGRAFSALLTARKLSQTAAKILAGVKYAAGVLIESFGAYASVKVTGGGDAEAWNAFYFAFIVSLASGAIELINDLKAINKIPQSVILPDEVLPDGVSPDDYSKVLETEDYIRHLDERGTPVYELKNPQGNHKVYIALDEKTNKIYIGRTEREVFKRMQEHGYKNPKKLIAYMTGLNYEQVRGVEQGLIDIGGGKKSQYLANLINGIGENNKMGKIYLLEGKKFTNILGELLLSLVESL